MSSNFHTAQVKAVREMYAGVSEFVIPSGVEEKCMDSGMFDSKSEYEMLGTNVQNGLLCVSCSRVQKCNWG